MGQLYEFEQGLRLEAEACRNDSERPLTLEMREARIPEGISKPSLATGAGAASWSEASTQPPDDTSANTGCSV